MSFFGALTCHLLRSVGSTQKQSRFSLINVRGIIVTKIISVFMLLLLHPGLYGVPRNLVVVEVGTGTWCVYCPGAAMGCHELLQNGHAVAIIKNQQGDSYANVYSNARNTYYNITGYPTAFFDGLNPFVGGSPTQSMYSSYLPKVNARLAVPSHFTISAQGAQVGNQFQVAVTVSKPEADTNTNVRLHAVLTESNIPQVWFNQTTVENVNRLMTPDQNGTPIFLDTGGTTTVNLSFTPNTSWNIANCEMVFFLQNQTTKEILQGVKYSLAGLVSKYGFTSTLGSYSEITGGTVLGTSANDNESFNAIPLGFQFHFNGVTYSEVSVQTNGFLAMGTEVLNTYLPLSSTTEPNNVVAALSRDIKSRGDGVLSYLLAGTAPDRTFTVQWKNYRRTPTACALDIFNFQIQLQENGNKVVCAYGPFTAVDAVTAQTVQVGLRGDGLTDFNNRTTTTDWTATIAGEVNNASCRINSTVFPPNGLVFTYSPPQQGTPPNPAQNPVPTNNSINVATGTNLSWYTSGGYIDGYKLYF